MAVNFWNDHDAAAHYVYGETPNAFVAQCAANTRRTGLTPFRLENSNNRLTIF
jgi:hypothetical protein